VAVVVQKWNVDAKLDFYSVARWIVNGDVVQAAHGWTNSGLAQSTFQLTYGVKQHPVATEERHYSPRWLRDHDDDEVKLCDLSLIRAIVERIIMYKAHYTGIQTAQNADFSMNFKNFLG